MVSFLSSFTTTFSEEDDDESLVIAPSQELGRHCATVSLSALFNNSLLVGLNPPAEVSAMLTLVHLAHVTGFWSSGSSFGGVNLP